MGYNYMFAIWGKNNGGEMPGVLRKRSGIKNPDEIIIPQGNSLDLG